LDSIEHYNQSIKSTGQSNNKTIVFGKDIFPSKSIQFNPMQSDLQTPHTLQYLGFKRI